MKIVNAVRYYLLMLPAILLGTLAMISHDVPSSIWLQNILIWIVGTIFGFFMILLKKRNDSGSGKISHSVIIIIILALPFLFNDLDGVHRWLSIGPITIYIASILMPLLLIHLWRLNIHENYIIGLVFVTLLILLFHPDAGQLTAFAFAATMIMWKKISTKIVKILSVTFTAVIVSVSWYFLDELAPVPYVEEVIYLVADLGAVWFVLGVLSLILLVVPFITHSKENPVSLSLGVYFLLTMIVTLLGNFPMPVMGYGISPIIGYIIAITWLIKHK